jgi:predicted permease
VIQTVAPVFTLAAVGFVWVKAGFEYRVQFVTRLAMTLSVPCLIFVALMNSSVDTAALTTITLASVVAYGAVTLALWALVALAGLDRRTFLAPLIFGNTGNLGLPLALFAFGETGLGLAVVIFAVMAVWSFTFGVWLVSGGGSPLRVLKEPMVGATLLGALFLWQGWQTPDWVTNTLQLTGQMAIPLMLAWATGLVFALDQVALAVLVLQVATPVAVTSYLLAEKYQADADAVAGLVVASTLLSVITIPLTLAFFL